eukprot:TRINITY_DN5089_c0_g1_i1.p1 TRINITY_DN5089_c0_g1~~TRINITY_DN5089_c0_g1_i1.p1  ORF type:complete len:252 (-),score=45.81 TRINITY_DN5089_c0_g1_i1:73-828(-)
MGANATTACCTDEEDDLPGGNEDRPGYAPLPKMSPLLSFGNKYSAGCRSFGTVISTVVPVDRKGKPKPSLSSHTVFFEDDDSAAKRAVAKQSIIEGATLLKKALNAGQETLVHCEWGQNRSGAICAAFAVLYLRWSADDAIEYVRQQNETERLYYGQNPMSNPVFNEIVKEIECKREELLADASPVVSTPQQVALAAEARHVARSPQRFVGTTVMLPQSPQWSAATQQNTQTRWHALSMQPSHPAWNFSAR